MNFFRDTDPHARADITAGPQRRSKPEGPPRGEVDSIEAPVNSKCRCEPSRSAREIFQIPRPPVILHQFDPLDWLDSPDEHSFARAVVPSRNIQHEMIAVCEIDIRMAAFKIKRKIARSGPAKCVCCGIPGKVSLRLHNAPGKPASRKLAHKRLADQKTRERLRVERKLQAAKPANGRSFLGPILCGHARDTIHRREFEAIPGPHSRPVRVDSFNPGRFR